MTSSQHGLNLQGDTHATMGGTMGCQAARRSQAKKTVLSSDCRLQLACMKVELLVNAHQPRRVEYVPGPCTHRPSRHGSWSRLKPVGEPAREATVEGRAGDWDEVVTR
jgi:hypothetical protein